MRETLIGKKLISVILIVAFTAVSCTSYKVVKPPGIENRVKAGDMIRVVTTDGRDVKFKVTAVTSDTIVGENQRVLLSDIATLEKLQIDNAKTAVVVAGGVAAFIGMIGLVLLGADL